MAANLLDLQRTLRRQGILISFSGRFSQEIIEELGEAVKKYLETEATSQNQTYNVFSVFIEQTQNIKNYGVSCEGYPDADEIAGSGIVTIGKTNSGYFVCSGNLIANSDVNGLQAHLELLAAQDKSALKKMYKEQLKRELSLGRRGAGLGLIDMAKRATQPLEFSFIKQNDRVSFFTLWVHV
ncbi:MAG: SiaB family protein kinase [Negativicutes bacterium]|nr:SiaB family protein kinase [Negativicutes bacterium]